MEAMLKFNLPEDEEIHGHCMKGPEYHAALFDFYHNSIRKRLKYSELSQETTCILEELKDEFFQELTTRGIEL